MLDSISAASAAQRTEGGAQSISPDVESFLTLLTAQISNQDPLEPMDSTTFVSQLAQLSQVEQSMGMGQQLETISTQLADATTVANLGLIGRVVEVPGDAVRSGGEGALSYELGGAAERVTASVLGPDGAVLRTIEGLSGAAGRRHELRWDGDDDAGLPVIGDGPFSVALTAEGADGAPVAVATWVEAMVEDVVSSDGASRLSLDNGTSIESSAITRVR